MRADQSHKHRNRVTEGCAPHTRARTSGNDGCGGCPAGHADRRGVLAGTPTLLSCGRTGRASSGSLARSLGGRSQRWHTGGGGGPVILPLRRTACSGSRLVPSPLRAVVSNSGRDSRCIRQAMLHCSRQNCSPTHVATRGDRQGCRSGGSLSGCGGVRGERHTSRTIHARAFCAGRAVAREGRADASMPVRTLYCNTCGQRRQYGGLDARSGDHSGRTDAMRVLPAPSNGRRCHRSAVVGDCEAAGRARRSARTLVRCVSGATYSRRQESRRGSPALASARKMSRSTRNLSCGKYSTLTRKGRVG